MIFFLYKIWNYMCFIDIFILKEIKNNWIKIMKIILIPFSSILKSKKKYISINTFIRTINSQKNLALNKKLDLNKRYTILSLYARIKCLFLANKISFWCKDNLFYFKRSSPSMWDPSLGSTKVSWYVQIYKMVKSLKLMFNVYFLIRWFIFHSIFGKIS